MMKILFKSLTPVFFSLISTIAFAQQPTNEQQENYPPTNQAPPGTNFNLQGQRGNYQQQTNHQVPNQLQSNQPGQQMNRMDMQPQGQGNMMPPGRQQNRNMPQNMPGRNQQDMPQGQPPNMMQGNMQQGRRMQGPPPMMQRRMQQRQNPGRGDNIRNSDFQQQPYGQQNRQLPNQDNSQFNNRRGRGQFSSRNQPLQQPNQ